VLVGEEKLINITHRSFALFCGVSALSLIGAPAFAQSLPAQSLDTAHLDGNEAESQEEVAAPTLVSQDVAQAPDNTAPAKAEGAVDADGPQLEEIIVTAQRREQSLKDVPVTVSAVGGEAILEGGFSDLGELQNVVPGLNIAPNTQNQSIMIRGVGTQGSNFGFEQAVPTFIDGIFFGRGSQVHSAFLDIERVEILKGPQPVFFGQNATGGAISITTTKPGNVWDGYTVGEIGNNNSQKIEFGYGGPVSSTIGVRVAGKFDRTDGHLTDLVTDSKFPHRRTFVGRVIAEWEPSSQFTATWKIEGSHINTGGAGTQPVGTVARADTGVGVLMPGTPFQFNGANIELDRQDRVNTIGLRPGPLFLPQPLSVRYAFVFPNQNLLDLSGVADDLDLHNHEKMRPWHTNLKLDYEFGNDITLTSQTGFSKHKREYVWNFGTGGPFVLAPLRRKEDVGQLSQEIRLTSGTGQFLEWMVGGYYQKNKMRTEADFYVAAYQQPALSSITAIRAADDARWLSAFAALTFNLSEQISVDVGARYSDVHKEGNVYGLRAQWIVEGGGPPTAHGQRAIGHKPLTRTGQSVEGVYDDDSFDPQVSLRWRPTDEISVFGRWARATKAGGFQSEVVSIVPASEYVFDAEKAEMFEAGVKGRLFNRRLNLNVTAFASTFSDLQFSSFDNSTGRNRTLNIGKQRVRGVEFDGRFAATDRMTIGFGGALIDSVIVSFPGATCAAYDRAQGLCTGPGRTVDRSGTKSIMTPDWQFLTDVNYWVPYGENYKIKANAFFKYSDGYLTSDQFDPAIAMEDFADLSITVGFGDIDDKWTISAFGRNLTNPLPTYRPELAFDPEGYDPNISSSQVRSYGLQLSVRF
jgi:outer membrane receptor protein involved in Fe transport